jgi:transcription-repair coupling factor (superfamily II helicase)
LHARTPKNRTGGPRRSRPAHTTLRLAPRAGALALRLLDLAREAGARGVILVASSERRAGALTRILKGLAPDLSMVALPAWDCLPYDRAPPSREVMGRRVVALTCLAEPHGGPRIVVATPDALVQRVPAQAVWSGQRMRLTAGGAIADIERSLQKQGYVLDERVDEPGEIAIRGQVVDLFPAGGERPVRIEHASGVIAAMRCYDPVSQLTLDDVDEVVVHAAAEYALTPDEEPLDATLWLPPASAVLETVFDYIPDATLVLDDGAEQRRLAILEQIADAYASRARFGAGEAGRAFPDPDRFYMSDGDWLEQLARRRVVSVETTSGEDGSSWRAVPSFATSAKPVRAFAAFVEGELKAKRRVALAASGDRDFRALSRRAREAIGVQPTAAADWASVMAAKPGAVLALQLDIDGGFIDEDAGVTVVTAVDVLGSRARGSGDPRQQTLQEVPEEAEFGIGDAVIHLDRGMGVLQGLESVETEVSAAVDTIRLAYADDDALMAPVDELDRIWRYGAGDAVALDRLDGEAWPKRRARIEGEIAETAGRLVALTREREARSAPKLIAPSRGYERFVARFPFWETPDQLRAIGDVLADLASGRPMDRLVCGDVGFGKTEVALRAAAAVALAGKQVAIVAPTTVLVRQHLQTFRRRFAGLGVEVGHLSRLVRPAEARAVKAGLTDGTIAIVIGTHALTGQGVALKDLGLVVIDEEQRFGLAHKRKLRDLARDVHVLTLTATPIPRTLQAAMLGLQDLSVIATPPAQRRPIRTVVAPFDEALLRQALVRERRRGGQSFVVCPRIEDIEPLAKRLATLVPELAVLLAHGKMPAAEIDDTMVRFADGDGDVLLATNIIESGLDVPRANTMFVWRADRFGLAQLHQLRGRVGRGRARGICYLITEPEAKIGAATRKRLATLETMDRLGAGFAISARDLDARGAGDLFGEDQAGHVKLIGMGLYRHLLERALRAARGEPPRDEWSPELNLGAGGRMPEDYVPEVEVRINLYARLAKLTGESEIDALGEEIEDRFGVPPEPVRELLALTRLKHLCRRAGIARVDAGPQAIAVTFRAHRSGDAAIGRLIEASDGRLAWRGDRLVYARETSSAEERESVTMKLIAKLAEFSA